MVDEYYLGEVKRISPEAPVPVFKKLSERYVLGGAANVAVNLVAAKQNVFLLSVIGNDEYACKLIAEVENNGIDSSMLIKSAIRKTSVKTRFLATNNQQVMRSDVEDVFELNSDEQEQLLETLKDNIHTMDLIILSDYLKGVLTQSFTRNVICIANANNVRVLVDVKDPDYMKYEGSYLIKPNLNELGMLAGKKIDNKNEDEIILEARKLIHQLSCEYILTTRGEKGMTLVNEKDVITVSAWEKEVYDVTGAGDTTIAYLAACLANDIEIENSVKIANLAAGIQVSKLGTSPVFIDELLDSFNKEATLNKLLEINQTRVLRKKYKEKKIVFTNGCFDILHIGHIRYLQQASKLGDILVVGLNSDSSVKRLKGESRPVNTEKDRAEMLCAFGFVDYVVMFNEDTPIHLIENIQPDVLVKGGDYNPDEVVGRDFVESIGGKLVLLPFVDGKSTTEIVNKFFKN